MFKKARIKLTAYYISIIAIGMIFFSVIFYYYSVRDIQHDISRETGVSTQVRLDIIHSTINELESAIIAADITILLVLTFLCYLLAGKTLKPISEALEAQEQFSANASHELRTPLAVMKTENEVFLEENHPSEASARMLAQSNLEEINRMTKMVEGLLMLARSKTTKQFAPWESVHLSDLGTSTSRRIEKLHQKDTIALQLDIEPNITLAGDQKLVEQLLTNLIQNAFTYTEKGFVKVAIVRDSKNAKITISDSGIGIDQKDLSRVMEPFFKTDRSRAHSQAGVGLGLSIVREITLLHKGTFAIESTPGKGTHVTVILPLI